MTNSLDRKNTKDKTPDDSRAGFLRSRKFLYLLGGLVACSFAGLIFSLYWLRSTPPTHKLESALRILQSGDLESAASIARSVPDEQLDPPELSQKHFVIGVQAREAATKIEQHSRAFAMNEASIEHLQKSQSIQFPNGYEGLANYHLGMALFDLFRWQEAVRPLEIATERWPAGRSDAIERLVEIDISSKTQDIAKARKRIEHWRSLPQRSPEDSVKADIKEMQVLLADEQFEQLIERLNRIPPDSKYLPQAQFVVALAKRQMFEKGKDASGKENWLVDALELHDSILKSPHCTLALRRRVGLEQGDVLKRLGRLPDALSAFSILRLNFPQTPEGLVAGVNEIETLLATGRGLETPATLEQLRSNLGDLRWYENDWLSLSALRERLLHVGQQFIDGQDFSSAEGIARSLPAFCEPTDRSRLESQLYEKWAQSLPDTPAHKKERTKLFGLAAQAYELLMNSLGRSTDYDAWLWHAITNYQSAEQFQNSNRLLERFLSLESRDNRPRGHFARAKNLQAMNRPDEAMAALKTILESTAPSQLLYDARLELARIKLKKEEYDEAQILLQDCLHGELRPESPTWQSALRMLAEQSIARGTKLLKQEREAVERNPSELLSREAELERAHKYLLEGIGSYEEYLSRFPNAADHLKLLYQLANAYQLASYWPGKQLQEGLARNPAQAAALEEEVDGKKRQAARTFAKLRREIQSEGLLSERDENNNGEKSQQEESLSLSGRRVSPLEDWLKSSYLGEADVYFQKGDYSEAAALYLEAAERYRDLPEGLEARKQYAHCLHKLGDQQGCLRAVQLMQELLAEIPATQDGRFAQVTSHDREGWGRYLTGLKSQWEMIVSKP